MDKKLFNNLFKIDKKNLYSPNSLNDWIEYYKSGYQEYLDPYDDPYETPKDKPITFNKWLEGKVIYLSRKRNFDNFWEKHKPLINSNNEPPGNKGLYIVELKNKYPISVNNHDSRRKESSIKVNYLNCKIGESTDLNNRRESYFNTFGKENVFFNKVAFLNEHKLVNKVIYPGFHEGENKKRVINI